MNTTVLRVPNPLLFFSSISQPISISDTGNLPRSMAVAQISLFLIIRHRLQRFLLHGPHVAENLLAVVSVDTL